MRCQGLVAEDQSHFLPLSSGSWSHHLLELTDTDMLSIELWSGRLKCLATGNPPFWYCWFWWQPSTERRCSPNLSASLRPVSPMSCPVMGICQCTLRDTRCRLLRRLHWSYCSYGLLCRSFEVHNSVCVGDVGCPCAVTCSWSGCEEKVLATLTLMKGYLSPKRLTVFFMQFLAL